MTGDEHRRRGARGIRHRASRRLTDGDNTGTPRRPIRLESSSAGRARPRCAPREDRRRAFAIPPRVAGGWKTTGRGRAARPSAPCRRAEARSGGVGRSRTPLRHGAAHEARATDVRGATSPSATRFRGRSGTKVDKWFDAGNRQGDSGSRCRTRREERRPTESAYAGRSPHRQPLSQGSAGLSTIATIAQPRREVNFTRNCASATTVRPAGGARGSSRLARRFR